MGTRPRKKTRTTSLTGIPTYLQGTHDSLCLYYAGAMLLASLRPEFSESFDFSHDDPIVRHMALHGTQERDSLVRDWLARGVQTRQLCDGLNRFCKMAAGSGGKKIRTQFNYVERNKIDRCFEHIAAFIESGTPCVLAWDGEAIGCHATLVVGTSTYCDKSKWLLLHDPSGDDDIEWDQLKRLCHGRLELLSCSSHSGYRPNRLTTVRGEDGEIVSRKLDRWDYEQKAWISVYSSE